MREIKFRAWDKRGEEMIKVSAIFFDKNVVQGKPPHILDEHNDIHLLTNIILMQYTGLKDKNGREIYEGDIVELHTPAEGIIGRYVVKWDEVAARFYLEGNWKIDPDEIWEHSQSWLTVVGNIYENPELSP